MLKAYHGTTAKNLARIESDGYLREQVFVTFDKLLAKRQAARSSGSLVLITLDVSGYKLHIDLMYRDKSKDPLLGKTYYIDQDVPVDRITRVERENPVGSWHKLSEVMYARMRRVGEAEIKGENPSRGKASAKRRRDRKILVPKEISHKVAIMRLKKHKATRGKY